MYDFCKLFHSWISKIIFLLLLWLLFNFIHIFHYNARSYLSLRNSLEGILNQCGNNAFDSLKVNIVNLLMHLLCKSFKGHSIVGHLMGVKSKILNSFRFPTLIQLIEKRKSWKFEGLFFFLREL